ncbi:MAG: CBS domain-containing protein [Gammaproteobacteria bacterium]|nr:CBS domain-containing protein [Gammaproteobacteria bacterium]
MSDDTSNSASNGRRSWLDKLGQLFREDLEDIADLKEVISLARQRRLIDDDTEEMLEGVLEVAEVRVRDIMIPRAQMVTVDRDEPLETLLPKIIDSAHSRIPVVNDDKDHVEGIIHAKDLLSLALGTNKDNFDLALAMRPAVVVPESKRVSTLLKEFRSKRYHMAIVVDEYGGVSGLVTIEDILELIVGEIEDEFDTDDDARDEIRMLHNRIYAVPALTDIDAFNEQFGSQFSEDEFDTIGGLVANAFGHLPSRGETVELDGFMFKVVSADARRVKQLHVRVPAPPENDNDA